MQSSATDPVLIPTSSVIGETVRNSSGEPLGQVKDLIFDLRGGCLAYVVLSFGGLLDLGKKLFAVPWGAVAMCTDDESMCLDIPRSQLEHAPSFDRDNWPDMNDRAWGAEIHSYYNRRPYWEST